MKIFKLGLLILIFSQCQYEKTRSSMIDAGYKFVKSIYTRDSLLFNGVAERDSLKESLQALLKDSNVDISEVPIMDVYFYRYSPYKISSEDLDSLVKSEFPFQQMNFKIITQNETKVVMLVEFFRNKSTNAIEMTIVKFKSGWKVTSAIPK